jgi:hypothetical protein
MSTQTYITVPVRTADKLAELGRAMLELAEEMKHHAALGQTERNSRRSGMVV